jgi:polyribonucleotide nucleotidyltransferase
MFKVYQQEMEWAGRILSLETGKIARQAMGSVMASYGDTRVLCTVVPSHEASPSVDFLPLSVFYQEKFFAAGKIPGGFMKREGKLSDREVLASRLIDRTLRPLFLSHFTHEVQIICTVLSFDPEADSVITALIGASAALALSGLPIKALAAGVRVGYDGNELVLNPSKEEDLSVDLVIAGTEEGIVVVESEMDERDEAFMLKALQLGHESILPVLGLIQKLKDQAGKHPFSYQKSCEKRDELHKLIEEQGKDHWKDLASIVDRRERNHKLSALKKEICESLEERGYCSVLSGSVFYEVWRYHARHHILSTKTRLDGRRLDEVRPIMCEVGILPRTHGSALFTRGETQALVTVTLGGRDDSQLVDGLSGTYRDPFMLHYNFPPFSVGETGKMGPTGRREVGHAKLGWKALHSVLPPKNNYTIRVVSEITESYGSSSMATVCGASLAMMDAGLANVRPVAGIAMGLVKEGQELAILSDISGTEDYLGDTDFKVAGTEKGITALQMDLKGEPFSNALLGKVLDQAKVGRLHILSIMASQTLSSARIEVSPHAPAILTMKIPNDRIRDLIGPGGKTIRELCEKTKSKIDVSEDGVVTVFSSHSLGLQQAESRIKQLTGSPIAGEIYQGSVVKLMEFGAFINFGFAQDGMVHISEISPNRVEDIHSVLSIGDKVRVKFLGLDDRGRVKLSIKQAE